MSNRLCRSDWNIQFPPVYYIKLYFGSPSAVGGHSSSHCSQSIPFPFLLSASFTPLCFQRRWPLQTVAPPACVCLWALGEPCSTHVSPQWQKNQTTCTHIWTHGSTGVKTNILLATREKTLVLVFSPFRRSPHVCYISALITIQFRVGCLCVIHTYVPGTVTNRHINTLQLCEILCKGNPRWEKLTAGTNWISLSLFVIMTQSVHSFLICICLLLFYIGGGTYTYTQCLHCNANLCQQTSFKGQLNCECFCSGCLWVCPHCQCCRLSSLLSPHTHSVTSGMLSQRECLMNVENENTSLMNSVTQLVQLIFLWRCWVKWSHGWLSHCFAILFYF